MNNQPNLRPQPIENIPSGITPLPRRSSRRRWVVFGSVGVLLLILLGLVTFGVVSLQPVDSSDTALQTVEISSGMTPSDIGSTLKEAHLIRSEFVFDIYTRYTGVRNRLQAGIYELSKNQSLGAIVNRLVSGPTAREFEITFLPGATLADNKRTLQAVGFEASDIDAAFKASYDHPLFTSRPAGADLEGYLFGETHRFIKGTSIDAVLKRFFDDYYIVVQENDLIAAYERQGLTLYQGITLASIIQRESGGDDKAQIAQIFYKRLKEGMVLGSDVTYQYIADKEGKPRDVNYDSPYNTRRYGGLPPGPIATPGVAALKAVASPASGDYLYFLSGDDDVTYYGRTFAEHEANIRNHCQQKCKII